MNHTRVPAQWQLKNACCSRALFTEKNINCIDLAESKTLAKLLSFVLFNYFRKRNEFLKLIRNYLQLFSRQCSILMQYLRTNQTYTQCINLAGHVLMKF